MTFGTTDSIHGLSSLSALDTISSPRHRWYFVKESFSPFFVDHAINNTNCVPDEDTIIDLFSGSGTVPLTAALNGFKAVALEVNPFLAFVSNTKLIQCTAKSLYSLFSDVIKGVHSGCESPLENFSTFCESPSANKWLFNRDVLRAFEGGWMATIGHKCGVRDVIRLCLIGAAMDACNAQKDGKCLRYRKDWKGRSFGRKDFVDAFQFRIGNVHSDMKEFPLRNPKASILNMDSRQAQDTILSGDKFKLCIMSPPYLNSFDYTDVYRPELFLGKFVKTHQDLQSLRLRTLRSHVQISWPEPKEKEFGHHFTESFFEIEQRASVLWDKRIPSMIRAYFEDLKLILTNLRNLAKPDATVWIVVSTSAYSGVEIPVDLIIADIASNVGWFLREVNVIHYLRRVSGQQWDRLSERKKARPHLRESIVILDAKPRKRK